MSIGPAHLLGHVLGTEPGLRTEGDRDARTSPANRGPLTAMCFFILLLLFGPRLVIVLWWLFEPFRWSAAFSGFFLVPILGFLFLPWTTLMYVLVVPGGIVGFDWLWIALAVLADLSSVAGGRTYQRRRGLATA